MRRRLPPLLLSLVLGLLSAFAVACGDGGDDGKLLGPNSADNIRAALDEIEDRVERGRCAGLDEDLDELGDAVANVPNTVDRRLRQRLGDGVRNLRQIAPGDCEDNQPETTETQPETTETLPPETTETVPPETTTTPPETTETVPPETTPPPPPTTEVPTPPEDTGGDQAPGARVPPGQAKKDEKG